MNYSNIISPLDQKALICDLEYARARQYKTLKLERGQAQASDLWLEKSSRLTRFKIFIQKIKEHFSRFEDIKNG